MFLRRKIDFLIFKDYYLILFSKSKYEININFPLLTRIIFNI